VTVFGGYFLTKAVERPQYVSALLPTQVLSLSDCICDFTPDVWAIRWAQVSAEERTARASKIGIDVAALSSVIDWTTQQLDSGRFGWPCVFLTLNDAVTFAERFLRREAGFRLLGIGLPSSIVDHFLAEEAPGPSIGTPGVYKAVSSRLDLETHGSVLGWEVLCYDYGGFHSWLCNGLENAVAERFGVRTNEVGFIAAEADASVAAEYCGQEDVGAEPGFWAHWLVMEYSLFTGVAS
jgi:hypothetical protein